MPTERIERAILGHLIHDEEYCRKVLPFLKDEYFHDDTEKQIYKIVNDFLLEYNARPSVEALKIEVSNLKGLTEKQYETLQDIVETLKPEDTNKDWLLDQTEKFCKDKSVYNAIMKSITIFDGKDKNMSKDAIPQILSEALAISFDPNVGHDYIEDYNNRYDFYHRVEERIAFDLEYFNIITKGGLPRKTLNVALAGTGVGKSLFMCHVAASYLLQGKNVLYISMEMAEERIAERIDANLLDVTVDQLVELPKAFYESKVSKLKTKTQGKLIIKEYPTASAHAGHFKALLNELYLKKSFKPDAVFIDYLNICASQRFKHGSNVNTYTYVKAIAEELRGLAVEHDVPIISATQTTRSGFSNTDPGLEDTSESFGLPATTDFMFALVSTEELESANQIVVKQLKNRYNDPTKYKRFVVGIDRAKMRLYDLEESAQKDLVNTNIPETEEENDKPDFYKGAKNRNKRDFSSFKY
jgi:archaellum biogenesis ATPase FlaH